MFLAAISLIAVTNLAVGYALGKLGVFDAVAAPVVAILNRRAAEPELELPIEEALTAPAPEPVPPPPEPPPAAAAPIEPDPVAPPIEAPPPEAPPEPVPAPAAETPPAAPAAKPSTADLMGSLASFRDKLSAASVELKLNREDDQRFDSSATKLQEVNHDYLDQVSTTIERLDELGAEGDHVARAAKSAVSENAKEVTEMSGEIDSLIEQGLDSESRAELVDKSIAIRDAAAATSAAADSAVEKAELEPPPEPAAAVSDKATDSLGKLFEQLEVALAAAADAVGDEAEVLLAEVRADSLAEIDDPATIEAAVLRELATAADQTLGETQRFFSGDRCLMLLEGDAFDAAAKRMEQLRQQMQAIDYERGGAKIQATVTCGLVEAHVGEGREALEKRLAEALAEAGRLGANRTFHHDGAFPTPIPEMPSETTPRTVVV
ncbi:MAG: hypothetical protein AAFV43_05555 [Planctomycetota bacterium]